MWTLDLTTALALAAGGTMLALIALISLFLMGRSIRRMERRLRALAPAAPGQDVFAVLAQVEERVDALRQECQRLDEARRAHEALLARSLQAPGVVRFNAFPEMGSDLSFCLAFLDEERNGVLVTCITGRSETRVYAKPVQRGESSFPLSPEEREALVRAAGNRR